MDVNWSELLIEITTFFENCQVKHLLAECVVARDINCLVDRILDLRDDIEVRDFVVMKLRRFPEVMDALSKRISFKVF